MALPLEASLAMGLGALTDLRGSLSGHVATPGDRDYARAITIDNGRVRLRPAAVVYADGVADVATALAYARERDLPLTVRGGGHSAAGYSLNEGGIVLDLELMDAGSVDTGARTLTVQMGATWADVYQLLLPRTKLIPIGGGCLPVGIPGFVLGGGFSFVSRSYGLSIDNLLSLTIVTADGVTRVLGPDAQDGDEAGLFWACRGGGGGNFGVAVEMVLQLHEPNTSRMLVARPRWPAGRAGEVIDFYNGWIETVPNELAVYGFWGPDKLVPGETVPTFGFTVVYNGDFGEGLSILEPLFSLDPARLELEDLTLPEIEELIGGTTVVGDRSAYMWSGVMPPGGFTPEVVAILADRMAQAPSPASFIVWTHLGGKVEEVAPDATAFPHRRGRFVPELKAIWDDPHDTRRNVEWAHAFYEELRPHLTGAYVNYIDPLLAGWPEMYYGDNYDRLMSVKQRWDPDRVFDFQQSVGSAFQPSPADPLDLSPLNRTFVPRGGRS